MKIGFVGLGKMGLNMVTRLIQGGHEVVVYNRSPEKIKQAEAIGAIGTSSLEALVEKLPFPKIVWLMIPAGQPTIDHVEKISNLLHPGDILIDGGNSYYKNSIKAAEFLKQKQIHFLDVGVSGGIWGLKIGYCVMVGGDKKDFEYVSPLLKTLAPENGFAHVGPNGAGHFTKMIHNGVEYAMLQAYAEGFEIMAAKSEFNLDLKKISHLWNQGSVVRSWLLELAENVFSEDPTLKSIKGFVEDSGEGRWTVQEAIDNSVPAPTITLALLERFRSRQEESFGNKFIAALRNAFGGHAVKKEGE